MIKPPILVSKQEQRFALIYLCLQLLVLPRLLELLQLLPIRPRSAATRNSLYFFLNFAAVVVGLRHFLKTTLVQTLEHLPRVLLIALLGFTAYWLISALLSLLILGLYPSFSNPNDLAITAMTKEHLLLMGISTVFFVPVAEECLHRGAIFGPLLSRSRILAYLVSAGIFAAIHIIGYIPTAEPITLLLCFLQYLPAGFCIAWCYAKADNIFTPILIHTAVNAMGMAPNATEELVKAAGNAKVSVIGDCNGAFKVYDCVLEAFIAAMNIL